METNQLQHILSNGEGMHVEFKRCGQKPESDTFETICAFANRMGGSIYLGVLDNGTVSGIARDALLPIERNVVNVIHNPKLFTPTLDVEFERIAWEDTSVLRIWVPVSSDVHSFKGVVYDRAADADVRVTSRDRMAMLYLRKQSIYSERRVYPVVKSSELRFDLLQKVRALAAGKRAGHPWLSMTDDELVRSAQLFMRNIDTGEEGYNLAAILLLGNDDLILSACPTYRTDALLRRQDTERYDDREVVCTNLIEAYEQLVGFVQRHLPDRHGMDGAVTQSPRDVIAHELVSNTLAHREYRGSYLARLEIGDFGIETKNASRAASEQPITPGTFNPVPKNPIIARFFNQIGYAEELGSGTRQLFRVARTYYGTDPLMKDGDVFVARIEDARSTLAMSEGRSAAGGTRADQVPAAIERMLTEKGYVTSRDVARVLGIAQRTARGRLAELVEAGLLAAEGSTKGKRYVRRY